MFNTTGICSRTIRNETSNFQNNLKHLLFTIFNTTTYVCSMCCTCYAPMLLIYFSYFVIRWHLDTSRRVRLSSTCVKSTCSRIVLQTTNQVQGGYKKTLLMLLTLRLVPTTCKRNCSRKHEDMRDRRHNKHASIHWLRPTARAVLFLHDAGLHKGRCWDCKNWQHGKPDITPVPSCRHTHASPAKRRSEIVVLAAQK